MDKENAKPELHANWTMPEPESPEPIPQSEPDIVQNDLVPPIAEQAHLAGWNCAYYSFGKLDDQGTDYFNPSLVMREDGIWLLTRASGLHPRGFMYGQNAIVAFKLDDEGKQPHHGKILTWKDALQLQHFEDPRVFYHPRLGQTMIGCCTFMWNGPGNWTGALQVFGAFDDDWVCKKVDYPKIGGNPGKVEKVAHKDYEKNWVWWLHEEKLHLLYKANPWTVMVFENRWSEKTEYKIDGITWPYGEIRGGTAPIQVGDLFFTFHHSSLPWKGRYRRYYAGAIGFETTPPYKPRLITAEPILEGSQNDVWAQRKPLVVFPCGALYLKDKWLVSMGVNDMKSAWLELSHASLLERMKPVEDVTGQIFQSSIPNLSGENRRTRRSVDEVERPSALEGELGSRGQGNLSIENSQQNESSEWTSADDTPSPAQTTLEKRRAALVKARAARAEKRKSSNHEFYEKLKISEKDLPDCSKPVQLGQLGYELKPKRRRIKRRRRRSREEMAEERRKALQEFEEQKTLASEEVKA